MSETAGTIIKLLAALTSPKTCAKYITVALSLFLSWKYLEPAITETKVSKEQLSIIILLFGVGIGSIVGHFVSLGFGVIWSKHEANKNEKLQAKELEGKKEEERIKKEKEKLLILAKIKKSFEHLHYEQKNTLRELTLGNKTLDISKSNNSALKENDYIQILVHVRVADYLVQINPIIIDFIKTQWGAEKESKVKGFIAHNEHANVLLNLLDENNQENEVMVYQGVLKGLTEYSECIRGVEDDRKDNEGYWVFFEDYLLEEFEKQTGKSYIDEVFIPNERISSQETTA